MNSPRNDGRKDAEPTDADAAELASVGYAQQLRRTMGAFSSFALLFSLISVISLLFSSTTTWPKLMWLTVA